jgi:hypothetical protein
MTDLDAEQCVTIELLGLARVLTSMSEVTLRLPEGASLREVASALCDAYPTLVGPVIAEDGSLGSGTVFSLDGREITRELGIPSTSHVVLLTTLEGG